MDTSVLELQKWDSIVRKASRDVDQARKALMADKGQRKDSLLARIVDFFTQTAPEKSVRDAESRLIRASERGRAAATAWITIDARHCSPPRARRRQRTTGNCNACAR